ncbi:hypothetical protein [Pseudomonas mangrovi]|uniref:Uncharacterized protein n=1 Tax=Pseudomonas mangrovi TaxID=2161748 RepID=A0A2T5P6U3_9PSED|nr:hypothetical protein [Pseudomonas mangrovi]PTU73460.1 hypothetical protein DBO85_14125 [Pseudomonas mangrovi]
MSASERDQDLWEMREISKTKRALFPRPCSPEQEQCIRSSEQYKSLQAKFDAIFIKYGNNPNIFKDSERANSKRNSGKIIKCTVNRSKKRAEKQKKNLEIKQSTMEPNA